MYRGLAYTVVDVVSDLVGELFPTSVMSAMPPTLNTMALPTRVATTMRMTLQVVFIG
jgi:hypothetical protein